MSAAVRTLGVIPSRYASQRLPAKALVDLLGKPMVQRVYEQALKATTLDRVVVATDDERIAGAVRKFGGDVVLTSPDIRSGTDRVAAVAEKIPAEIYVNVQGDEPLMPPEMIDQAVRLLVDDPEASVSTVARPIESADVLFNPSVVKVVTDIRGYALYFSRSPIPFVRDEGENDRWVKRHRFLKHIGLYCYRGGFLKTYVALPESPLEKAERLEQLRALDNGYRIRVGVTPFDSVPIDTAEDVQTVVSLLRRQAR